MADRRKGIFLEIVRNAGADLVGIASVDRIPLSYPPRQAREILPGAKSVVVILARQSYGAISNHKRYKPAIKDILMAYSFVDSAAARIARALEDEGFLSVAIPSTMPVEFLGRRNFIGEFAHRNAAIAAGLGTRGRNNLLITPQFGPRHRLASVLTEAELEPDEPLKEDVCTHCNKCVEVCPVRAFDEGTEDKPVDVMRCRSYLTRPLLGGMKVRHLLKSMFTTRDWLGEVVQTLMLGYHSNCHLCMSVCPVGEMKRSIQ